MSDTVAVMVSLEVPKEILNDPILLSAWCSAHGPTAVREGLRDKLGRSPFLKLDASQ